MQLRKTDYRDQEAVNSEEAPKIRCLRCFRVSRFRLIGSGAGFGSGAGSVSGSRFRAGWSSIPEQWHITQHKIDPASMGRWCPQADCGVRGPSGKRGINRGGWIAESVEQPRSRDRDRATPNRTRYTLTLSRIAISLMLTPWRTSQSQMYSLAKVFKLIDRLIRPFDREFVPPRFNPSPDPLTRRLDRPREPVQPRSRRPGLLPSSPLIDSPE